jgi:hypothetical protein
MNYEEEKASFLEEMRSFSEPTKRLLTIGTTFVVMIGVFYIWLGYVNGLVESASSAQEAVGATNGTAIAENQAQQNSGVVTFMQGMENDIAQGIAFIIGAANWMFGWLIGWVKNIFVNMGQYGVQPQSVPVPAHSL